MGTGPAGTSWSEEVTSIALCARRKRSRFRFNRRFSVKPCVTQMIQTSNLAAMHPIQWMVWIFWLPIEVKQLHSD